MKTNIFQPAKGLRLETWNDIEMTMHLTANDALKAFGCIRLARQLNNRSRVSLGHHIISSIMWHSTPRFILFGPPESQVWLRTPSRNMAGGSALLPGLWLSAGWDQFQPHRHSECRVQVPSLRRITIGQTQTRDIRYQTNIRPCVLSH